MNAGNVQNVNYDNLDNTCCAALYLALDPHFLPLSSRHWIAL